MNTPQQGRLRRFPAQRESLGNISPGSGTPRTRQKRIVRQKPLLKRIKELPSDLMLQLEIAIDNLNISSFAFPAGIALNCTHALIKMLHYGVKPGPQVHKTGWISAKTSGAGERLSELQSQSRPSSRVSSLTTLLSLCLVLASVLNALHLFLSKRPYRLHRRKDSVSSPNSHWVETDMSLKTPTLWESFKRRVLGIEPEVKRDKVLQVDVWTPPDVALNLFATYSPPAALAWHFINYIGWLAGPLLILAVALQTNFLIYSYSHLVKDRALIHAEVLAEYDSGFVMPRLFPAKRDAATSTNEAEMVFHARQNMGHNIGTKIRRKNAIAQY